MGHRFDIGQNDNVIDLGCNVGVFTVLAASAGRSVVAVEAQAGLVEKAESTLQMNQCADRARIVHGLVGADSGVFNVDPGRLADPWIGDPPRISMSDLVANLPVIDLLKIDIEGSEFALFTEESNLRWLAGVRRIVMEVHPEFGCAGDLGSVLGARGFRFQFVSNHGRPIDNLKDIGYLFAWR
jgi:FkbM family methyltransferase